MNSTIKILWLYTKKFKKNITISLFLLIILSVLTMIPGLLIKNIFDIGISKQNFNYVLLFGSLLAVVYVIKSVINYFSNFIFTKLSQNIILNIRTDISSKLLKLPMEFFNFHPSGYLTSRLNEINNIGGLFSANTFKIILSLFELVATLIILMLINFKLTLILCLLMPVYYIVSNKFLNSISRISNDTAEKNAVLNTKIQQTVQGIEEVKNLSVEDQETKKINEATENLIELSIKQSILYSVGIELIVLIGALSSVVLIFMGGRDVITQSMTIGGYMVFMNYLPKLYAPIQSISATMLTIQPALVSLKRLHLFIEQVGEDENDKDKVNIDSIDNIYFKDVSFKYNPSQPLVFKNLNFSISGNDKLIIQGKNGTGKTTIFRILMGLYNPSKGQVLINGLDISSITKKSLRKNIGIVSQKIYLFNDTIENNIKYGISNCADNKYNEVLKVTGLDEIINAFPEKHKTLIGENGSNLSGGQIQRIAIARALLKGVNVLLFDEATSQIDIEGRKVIKELISNQLNNCMCIFISHNDELNSVCNKALSL